jgi:hypothetical protein
MSSLGRRDFLGRLGALAAVPAGLQVQDSLAGRGDVGTLRDPYAVGRPRDVTRIEDYDERIKTIEHRLACNCGCTLDVFTCRTTDFTCTYSPKLHREVVAMDKAGKSAQEILDAFVAGTIVQEFWRGVRARRRMHGESVPLAFSRLVARNRRRYGGYLVHVGVLIYFVAFSGMAFKREMEATLKPGQSVRMQSPFGHTYTLTHMGVSQFEALNRIVSAATVSVSKDGKPEGLMTSEKRQHVDSFKRPTFEPSTEVGIRSGLQEDLYITYAGSVNGTEEAVYRFTINPLVWWLWFGGFVLVFGGVVTMWPGGGPTVAAPRRAGAGDEVALVGGARE